MQYLESTHDTHDGVRLFAQDWSPDTGLKAAVCLVHGLGEHSGRYAHVAETLTSKGYALQGFDLRGHGKSGGVRGNTPSYAALLDDIDGFLVKTQARYPGKAVFLYGHSLGGNLVLNFVLQRKPGIAGVLATGPWLRLAFDPPAWKVAMGRIMNSIYPSFSQASGLDTTALSRDEQVVKAYECDSLVHDRISARLFTSTYQFGYWALEHASELGSPTLLMHGSADRLTSAKASQEFAQKAGPACEPRIWEGFYHEIHNEPEQAAPLGLMVEWLDRTMIQTVG